MASRERGHMRSVISDMGIIDADTHVVEPPDLWTSRVATRWHDQVPQVRWDEVNGDEAWFVGGERISGVGSPAMAGWAEYPPDHPRRWRNRSLSVTRRRASAVDRYGCALSALPMSRCSREAHRAMAERDCSRLCPCLQRFPDGGACAPGRFLPMTSLRSGTWSHARRYASGKEAGLAA